MSFLSSCFPCNITDKSVAELESKRMEMCEAFYASMMKPLDSLSAENNVDKTCSHHSIIIGVYVRQLRAVRLIPHELVFGGRSLASLFARAGSITLAEIPNLCKTHRCLCRKAPEMSKLTDRLERTITALKGLREVFICLKCIKSDEKSCSEGGCQDHDRYKPLTDYPAVVAATSPEE